MTKQLTLPVNLRDDATFTNFYPGNNGPLIKALKNMLFDQGEKCIYLWGAPGVGRSHLMQASCHALNDQQYSVVYLPLRLEHFVPDILHGMEDMTLVCLDDIDFVLGKKAWEEALLYFYNRARDKGVKVIISGNEPPAQLPCLLADLQSRLSWGLVFQVYPLSDDQKLLALQMHARHRGIYLSREVGQYLLRHYPRNMTELFFVLNKLDYASLVAKKRLTIPFVKQILGN